MAPGINLVMTVIGFTVSTLFIVFVCTRLICARIRYLSNRRIFRSSSTYDHTSLERGLRGIEPLVVANFPTKKFSDPFFCRARDARCTVCLSEFRSEDTLRILPFCGHFFHSTCIDIWLQQHCTCPVCRVSLRELYEQEHSTRLTFCVQPNCTSARLDMDNSVTVEQGQSTDVEPESLRCNSGDPKCTNKHDECTSEA